MNSVPNFALLLDAQSRSDAIVQLQSSINDELKFYFEKAQSEDRNFIATYLIEKVEALVEELNEKTYDLGRIDYGGDIDYENSEQTYSNKLDGPDRITLEFIGFFCTVSWES